MFKCKKCKKLFNFDDFKKHYSNCDKEVNENDESNYNDNNTSKDIKNLLNKFFLNHYTERNGND